MKAKKKNQTLIQVHHGQGLNESRRTCDEREVDLIDTLRVLSNIITLEKEMQKRSSWSPTIRMYMDKRLYLINIAGVGPPAL